MARELSPHQLLIHKAWHGQKETQSVVPATCHDGPADASKSIYYASLVVLAWRPLHLPSLCVRHA